jgi:hypothetical protein
MDNKIFKKFLREGIEAHKSGQQKSVKEVFGKVASVDTGRGRRPASVRGGHDDEGERAIPNFKEYSASGCTQEEWETRVGDGEDPETIKCAERDQDGEDGEEKLIWGLNSTNNPDSLKSLLLKHKVLDANQIKDLIRKIIKLARIGRVPQLEEQLSGDRGEKQRVFDLKATTGLLHAIASFNLNKDVGEKLLRVLDLWGRKNTVRFEPPAEKVQLWADEEPSGDDREAKLAAKEKEWDEKGLNKAMGEPIGPDDEEYAEETPEETGEAGGEEEQTTLDFEEDEEEFERAETEEIPKPAIATKDVDFCKGLLDSIKTSDPKLFAAMEDDDTIRGAIANFANDLSFSADAVVLSALGAAAAIPPAAPFFGAIASGAEVTARSGAAVAVAMDLMLLNGTDALIDSIGLIPWGKWIGKALGKTGDAVIKAGEKASSEATQKLLKTAGKGAKTAAESGIKNLEKTLAEKLLKAAPTLGEEGAKNAAKAIMVAVEQRVQTKLKAEGEGPGAPDPNKYKDPKEYKRALKAWQAARKEAIEGEYKNCFRKDNLEIKNRALNFIKAANDYVDDFPAAFDAVIGKGIDAVVWAKDFIFDQDEDEETEEFTKDLATGRASDTQSTKRKEVTTLRAPEKYEESKTRLNEQRYKMLLKRFKIK